MKKFFAKVLKSIEAANKQNFGTKKMDCCDLNKTPETNRKSQESRQS